ncbi:MAG: sigma factor-like helix-turn-helix DNA-binding protein, partial [Patescibacteria group bacterium]
MNSQNYNNQEEDEKPVEDSVLDRVMSESETHELAQARPSKVVTATVNKLRDRERDVLIARYGINPSHTEKETLESIGKKLSVTRERVRQIENAALKKIAKKFSSVLKPLWKVVDVYLTMHGNIADVDFLTDHFKLSPSDNLELEKNSLRLALAA